MRPEAPPVRQGGGRGQRIGCPIGGVDQSAPPTAADRATFRPPGGLDARRAIAIPIAPRECMRRSRRGVPASPPWHVPAVPARRTGRRPVTPRASHGTPTGHVSRWIVDEPEPHFGHAETMATAFLEYLVPYATVRLPGEGGRSRPTDHRNDLPAGGTACFSGRRGRPRAHPFQ